MTTNSTLPWCEILPGKGRFIWLLLLLSVYLMSCSSQPVSPDLRQHWLTLAAEGDNNALYQLGRLSCCGYGPGKSTVTAARWFCQAATRGHALAQYELGRLYAARADTHWTHNLRQDLIFGYTWFGLAAQQNVGLAVTEQFALARDMTDREISIANEMQRDWQTMGCPS